MPDSYYDPPPYDGCEDCDCEDVEHPERPTCMCKLLTGQPDDDCDACEQVCECKCHNLPPEPEEYDLELDRRLDDRREDY